MPVHRSSPRRVLAVLAAGAGAFSLLQSLVTPVLPTIQADLHTDASSVVWVLTAWLLSAAVATPLLGRVGDLAGKDRTLVAALLAVAAGCVVAALAPSLPVLLAGRVVQGLGGAVFAVSFGILRDEFPAHRVPSAVGVLSAVIAAGGGLGVVLAGPVVTALGWRALFWVPAAAVSAVALLARRLVPASPARTAGRVDGTAALLLSGGLVALLVPLTEAPGAWGWTAPRTVGLLVLAAGLLAAWVRSELRSGTPLIDVRMMRARAVWVATVLALLVGAVMFGVYAFLPQFVQVPRASGYGLGLSVTAAGLLMLPMLATMALAGVVSGPVARVLGFRRQLVLAALLEALGCAALAVLPTGPAVVAVAGAVLGVGFGLAYAALASVVVQSVPADRTGAASGLNANVRTIGGALGTAVVSGVLTASAHGGGLPSGSGFTAAFWVLAGLAAAGAVVALLVPATAARPEPAAVPRPAVPVVPAAAPADDADVATILTL
jgi:MFS family permease